MHASLRLDRVEGHTYIASWLGPESIVVDLGMNRGEFARSLSHKFGCVVTGVEPNPFLASSLAETERLHCDSAAIAASSGMVEFRIDCNDPLASAISQHSVDDGRPRLMVRSVTLSDFLQGCDRVDLLKSDIEGAEIDMFNSTDWSVFEGIPQITIEFHSFIQLYPVSQVQKILSEASKHGFFWKDFSTNFTDVLLINKRMARIGALENASLTLNKYLNGARRVVNRWLSANEKTGPEKRC